MSGRSMMSWNNLQSSLNFNGNLFELNSKFGSGLGDESISGGLRLSPDQYEDDCNLQHFLANENTINFSDIIDRRFTENTQFLIPPPRNFNQSKDTDILKWAPTQNLIKRGLKHLAFLLFKTILKKSFTSHQEIANEIERLLVNRTSRDRNRSKEERLEEKNIKRRIYDALNVMMSAGILEREIETLERDNHSQLIQKHYTIANRKDQLNEEAAAVHSRVTRKKELLDKLQSQYEALRRWTKKKQQMLDLKSQRLLFPIIMLLRTRNSRIQIEMQEEQVSILHNNLQVYSQIDALEEVYRSQTSEKQQRTAQKLEFDQNQFLTT